MISSLLLFSAIQSTDAFAQGIDGLDDPVEEDKDRGRRRGTQKPDVKEINKGLYAKANVGGAGYVGQFRGFVKAGTAVGASIGQDFVDREKTSMAWELGFMQGIHNGCDYEFQADQICSGANGRPSPYIQGDTRTYQFTAAYEFSKYPTRRLGLGIRVGGGGFYSPLLMDEELYLSDVVQKEWNIAEPGYHGKFKGLALGGITAEYYSKLSHFSLGFDGDIFYAIGFDAGFNATGYMKYTF